MSCLNFNDNYLPKTIEFLNSFTESKKDDFKAMFQCFDKLEEEFLNAKARTRDKSQRDKTTLQSINEDETDVPKVSDTASKQSSDSNDSSSTEGRRRGSNKRTKHEVEGMESPEQEKRQKRNASVKAQSIIAKQIKGTLKVLIENVILVPPNDGVNVNLTQKLRRENSTEKGRPPRSKNDDKENTEPLPVVQVKQEKISILPEPEPEPMELSSPETLLQENVTVKQEPDSDEIAMPPPPLPGPRSRKAAQKQKPSAEESAAPTNEESNSSRGSMRSSRRARKQTETVPPPTAASRSTRGSSRSTKQPEGEEPPPAEPRPKRTRAKKVAETAKPDGFKSGEETQPAVESEPASPAEKPRPKRTRRIQKAAEKEKEIAPEPKQPDVISPKEERISHPEPVSPILQTTQQNSTNNNNNIKEQTTKIPQKQKHINNNCDNVDVENINKQIDNNQNKKQLETVKADNKKTKDDPKIGEMNTKNKVDDVKETDADDIDTIELDQTRVIQLNATVTISKDLDTTVVLPNGVYNHAPFTPKAVQTLNETVVLEHCRETVVLDKQTCAADTTVLLDKGDAQATHLTDDNSLLTDDSDAPLLDTPQKNPPTVQPTSAVKEKVQQFEELASRVTRTKTRAMTKQDEPAEHTPPDKVSKVPLSKETLAQMNSMIFNGKPPQVSKSASKLPMSAGPTKSVPMSASKLSGISKAREADELRREREDARKKKEALLEAKREMQKKKREDKMAAAAAARLAAERERRAAMEAAARERMEKQAHADLGKQERLREVERKKQETARKVAETEERRRAEEQARQQRLADEQRRAEAARKKAIEEAEALKKEAALEEKEIERKRKEFMEKQQRLKQRMEQERSTPHKMAPQYAPDPVHMEDGFEYLKSDEEDDGPAFPAPAWSTSKGRRHQLAVQERVAGALVAALFQMRPQTPDLRDIFPSIERTRLKRTSSAVWNTPPRLPVLRE